MLWTGDRGTVVQFSACEEQSRLRLLPRPFFLRPRRPGRESDHYHPVPRLYLHPSLHPVCLLAVQGVLFRDERSSNEAGEPG